MTKTGLIAAVIIGALWAIGGSPAFAAVGDTCTSSAACPEGYCAKETGDCAGPGVCRGLNPGLMCANVYEPVCGCDGKTYGNICEAERVGVNVQHPGRCIIVGTCGDNTQCPSGYCSTIPGSCDAIGTCAPRPIACTDSYNPVCGCDGTTYPNECMAATAGISVAFQGACPSLPTACHTNNDCPNQTCSKNPGDCGGTGVCVTPPPVCTNLYEPVCGCDGKTYPNNCEALRAGITIVSLGMCKPACVPTSTREKGKACKDRIDNDCDGLIDRLDVDCK